jgi:predicted metal-binding membrane protein
MDRLQKTLLVSLISVSAVMWFILKDQADMMMMPLMTYDPLAFSLFIAVWTAGMAAMMFPAISPMVLLYNKLITGNVGTVVKERSYPLKIALFVGSYLAVWALVGAVMLLTWSVLTENFLMGIERNQFEIVYGIILLIAGAYQFSPLKTKCLGYCESPMSFFTRRWRRGTVGAIKMGTYHGLYCLGCCWPYFLLMLALGWMNLAWMALFAGVIFGEKIWRRGIWVARVAGTGFIIFALIRILAAI